MSNRALEMSTRFFRLLPLAFCIPFKYKYPHLLYQSSENELHQTIRRRREEEFGKIIDSHTQKGTVWLQLPDNTRSVPMAEEFINRGGVCSGNRWNPSRNMLFRGCLSPCSGVAASMASFGWPAESNFCGLASPGNCDWTQGLLL